MMNNDRKEQLERHEDRVAFSQLGQQVVNNVVYRQAMTAVQAHLFEVFANTSAEQSEERKEAWRTMQNLKALEQYFEEVLTTGKISEEQLELLQSYKS